MILRIDDSQGTSHIQLTFEPCSTAPLALTIPPRWPLSLPAPPLLGPPQIRPDRRCSLQEEGWQGGEGKTEGEGVRGNTE